MLDHKRIVARIESRFGIPVDAEPYDNSDGQCVRLRPRFEGLPDTRSFAVEVCMGWRSVEAEFVPGSYAADLVKHMARANPQQRLRFASFARVAEQERGNVEIRLDGSVVRPQDHATWPTSCSVISLRLNKSPIEIPQADSISVSAVAEKWGSCMLGMCFSLMPLEMEGEEEGGHTRVEQNKHERSSINRSACIAFYGARCLVCGFDFERTYGEIGQGYIEVHHRDSVSELPAGTILDPINHLVPLCSNCHSMVHRRTPPYSIESIQALIQVHR